MIERARTDRRVIVWYPAAPLNAHRLHRGASWWCSQSIIVDDRRSVAALSLHMVFSILSSPPGWRPRALGFRLRQATAFQSPRLPTGLGQPGAADHTDRPDRRDQRIRGECGPARGHRQLRRDVRSTGRRYYARSVGPCQIAGLLHRQRAHAEHAPHGSGRGGARGYDTGPASPQISSPRPVRTRSQ